MERRNYGWNVFNYIWENDSMTYNKLKSEKTLEWLFSNIRNPKVLKMAM